jgi:hypothetical protein
MNKNLTIGVGLFVSLIAIGAIFIGDNTDIKVMTPTVEADKKTKEVELENASIEYEESNVNSTKQQKKRVVKKRHVKPKEKGLVTQTHDSSNKFEISIIDPNEKSRKKATRMITVRGKVEGKPYVLAVPDNLIGSGNEVTIRIKDIDNGTEQSVAASFIDELSLNKPAATLNLDPYSGNYDFKQKNSILPFPGDPVRLPGAK